MKIKTRRYYLYYLLKTALIVIRLIPRRIGLMIASFAGKAVFRVLGKYKDISRDALTWALGCDKKEASRITERIFINLAKNGIDWIKSGKMEKEALVGLVAETEGVEVFDEIYKQGKGAIILASHFGNWEMINLYCSAMGYKGTVIGKKIYFHKYDKIITDMRGRFGTEMLYRDDSPKKLLKALKDGHLLGILADQDVDSVEGVFVDFFGRPAYTPVAPVKIAMTTGAVIFPSFMIRLPDDRYKFVMESPIKIEKGQRGDEAVKQYTQEWNRILEKYVRKYPDQWVWVHERWKTQDK